MPGRMRRSVGTRLLRAGTAGGRARTSPLRYSRPFTSRRSGAVLAIDETGFIKKDTGALGWQRQLPIFLGACPDLHP